MIIESRQNEIVKRARALGGKKARDAQGLHFIEGEKMIGEALRCHCAFSEAFIEPGHTALESKLAEENVRFHIVNRSVMESLAQTDTPQWVCACVKTPDTAPPCDYPVGLIAALDAVQDPGNLGTIIRTADAMGACGVLLGAGCADAYAPKTLRASMGSIYHLPVWRGELPNELQKLKNADFPLVCGHLQGDEELPQLADRCVLVIGNEGHGASETVSALCHRYRLRMYGRAESLNASIAAAIMLYQITGTLHTTQKE